MLKATTRIIAKSSLKRGQILGSIQDRSREFISLLAYVCADSTRLPPGLIYQAESGDLQDIWLNDFNPKEERVYFASS